ncbi:MAG: nickel pincer cofactor biosynthesis protein LarC [bacterium]
MKILRFDSMGGASGDMILASLVELGANLDTIRGHLQSLPVEHFEITSTVTVDGSIRGTHLDVKCHEHNHHCRNLGDIVGMISAAQLPDTAKKSAIAVFQRLADAEAEVHGTTPDKIHFHEIGAVDSIVDIVASCLAVDLLGAERVTFGPLPVGRGTVKTEHGVMPLPVPAVARLLKGYPVSQTEEPFEMVTPTGAALLTTWAVNLRTGSKDVPDSSPMTILGTGYGIGTRKLKGRPNAIRAMLMETTVQTGTALDECLLLECNIDDTIPELIGSLTQRLMIAGALDVFTTAIQMKKQRPGTLLTVLCRPVQKQEMLDLIFRESSTFGVREHLTSRTILERRHIEITTPYGKVRVKVGTWGGRDITWSPEHDDCTRCADEKNVPVRSVYESALRMITGQ